MSMLEAEAAGLPVVSCALRGVPDVVIDGRSGLLAPPGDAPAFAALVRSLLEDPSRRRAMGDAAARFVGTERDIDTAARTLDVALAQIAPDRPQAAARS